MSDTYSIWINEKLSNKIGAILDSIMVFVNDNGIKVQLEANLLRSELLYAIKKEFRSEGTLLKSLKQLRSKEQIDILDFEKIYLEEINIVKRRRSKIINYILPLNIQFNEMVDYKFEFLNQLIEIIPVKDLFQDIEFNESVKYRDAYGLYKKFCKNNLNHIIKFSYVMESLQSHETGFNTIYPLFKGVLEFSLGYLGGRIFSTHESPRAVIPHPKWIIEEEGEKFNLLEIETDIHDDTKQLNLKIDVFNKIKKNFDIFKNKSENESTEELISVCLRQYSAAKDVKYSELAFLGYWQVAETITLVSNRKFGGNNQKVINRLSYFSKFLLKNKIDLTYTLSQILSVRNDFVHRGEYELNESILNFLKYHCDVGIMWLINNRKKLPTIFHIDHFYSWNVENDKNINRMKEVIRFIENLR